jgi:RNA polymerase sigma-70 factor, ECF subfamily
LDLEGVFRAYQQPIFTYFFRVCGNRQDAEELTQETFARVCSAAVRYRGDGPVSHWLFAIARRVLLEASRRGLFSPAPELDQDPPAPEIDHEARLDLEAAFSKLGLLDREALMLVDYLGYTPSDGAHITRTEASAFRMRLHRARRRLREQLETL